MMWRLSWLMSSHVPERIFLKSFAPVPNKHPRAEALRQEVPADNGVALYHVSAKVGTMSRLALGRRDELCGKRGGWRGSASVAMESLCTTTVKQETLGTFCGRLAGMHYTAGSQRMCLLGWAGWLDGG